MFNLNIPLNDQETLYNLSTGIDNMGNIALGVATLLGLVSIDLVILCAILNQDKKNEHHRDHSNQTDWQLFWLTQWYFNRYDHHCCHSYEYHRHQPLQNDAADYYYFLAATVLISFLCTIVAVILALHFHLLTLAFILAGVWGISFALKGIAWAIRPNLTNIAPPAQASQQFQVLPTAEADLIFSTPEIPLVEAQLADTKESSNSTPSAPPLPYPSF